MTDEHCIGANVLRKLIGVIFNHYWLEGPSSETKKLMEHKY